MKSINVSAVFLICYQRPQYLREILDVVDSAGYSNLYVSLDFPSVEDELYMRRNNEILSILEEYSLRSYGQVFLLRRNENVGSAVSVLAGLKLIFAKEESVIVIEDDCIPSPRFFEFIKENLDYFNLGLGMIAGSRKSTPELGASSYLSIYPQIWGWYTNQTIWLKLFEVLIMEISGSPLKWPQEISRRERKYWEAGIRRSANGYLDAWDIPLTVAFLKLNLLALIPPVSLVSNIGNDSVALHSQDSPWIGRQGQCSNLHLLYVGDFLSDRRLDKWTRQNFYKIRLRHVISTKITHAIDLLYRRRFKKRQLICRLNKALKEDFVLLPNTQL